MPRALDFPEASPKLVFSERGEVVLAMTATNDAIELSPLQVALLKSFDGKTELADISARISEQFGEAVSVEDIAEFLPAAKQLGMLSLRYGGPADEEVAQARCQRIGRKLKAMGLPPVTGQPIVDEVAARVLERLKKKDPHGAITAAYALLELVGETTWSSRILTELEALGEPRAFGEMTPGLVMIPLEDPSERLKVLDRWFGWLYSPLGLLFIIAFTLGGVVAMTNFVFPAPSAALNPVVLLTFYASQWVALIIHEYAHALTCTHYGQPVKRIGVGLIGWVMPIFWADITRSYLIPERWKRLMVVAGGLIGTALVVAGMAYVCLLLPPESPIRQGLLLSIAFDILNSFLINAVPFAEFDGYYFMSEVVRETNVKARARAFLFAVIGKFFVGEAVELPEQSPRSMRILLFFSFGRLTWFVLLYTSVAAFLYEHLVGRWRGYGLALMLIITLVALGPNLLDLFSRSLAFLVNNFREMLKRKNAVRIGLTTLALLLLLFAVPLEESAEARFVIAPSRKVDVRTTVEGQVEELLIKPGDSVKAGQLLAKLTNRELTLKQLRAEADVDQAKVALARLESGATLQEKQVSRATTRAEQASYLAAKAEANRSTLLGRTGVISVADNEASQLGSALAKGRLGMAEQTRRLVEAGSREEDIAAARARVTQAETALELADSELAALELYAPINGVVTDLDLQTLHGRLLGRGDVLLTVQSDEQFVGTLVTSWVPDPNGLVGSRTRLFLPTGKVVDVNVSSVAMKLGTDEPIAVETALFNVEGAKAGMAGQARLYGKRVPIAVSHVWHPIKRFFVVELWSSL